MDPAFWDTSALVPLCVEQEASGAAKRMSHHYGVVVWWAAPVEVRSAFSRMIRTGHLVAVGQTQALEILADLRAMWREIAPTPSLRDRAERLLDRFPLKAADALQLAAAMAWASGRPRNRPVISGDAQLLEAARELGFQALAI
jgi:predicted nucleic acid-binding protein